MILIDQVYERRNIYQLNRLIDVELDYEIIVYEDILVHHSISEIFSKLEKNFIDD